MKALLAGLLLLVACHDDVEKFPVNPGGGSGPGGTGFVDAGALDGNGDAGDTIAARVCRVLDARSPTTCAPSGNENLTVMLGSATATTAADGSFTIARPTSTTLTWRISGAAVRPSAMSFSALTSIPAMDAATYDAMVTGTQISEIDGDGTIIMTVRRGTTPVSGLVASSQQSDDQIVLFDSGDPLVWDPNTTSTAGAIWVPNVRPPSATVTITQGQAMTDFTAIPVFPGTVTFVLAEIP